jgi:pimeloyl-ACP methyl ester carboxylesterase
VRRLIAVDMPAHGFSDLPRGGMRPDNLLEAVFEALDTIIGEPAAVFGNSLGGYAAVRYALERPERVKALLLASPAGARTGPADIDEIRSVFDLSDHDKALEFVDRLLARPGPLRHFFAWGARRKLTRGPYQSLLQSVDPDTHSLDPEAIRALDVPILLVWGEADRILPTQHLEFWRQSLPGHAEIEELSGMGHSPFLDRPGALTKRLVTFLSSLDDLEP